MVILRDILIAILNQFNWEYCIESNNNVIYSSNYKNIINNKVDFNIFKFNNTYYQKINRRIVLDDKEYKIECLEDVTSLFLLCVFHGRNIKQNKAEKF